MSSKPIRVAILHQGFIPLYRVRFYELLNQFNGIEYVVFHGAPAANSGWIAAQGPFAFPNRWVNNKELRIGGWRAIYQPIIWEILSGSYDLVVLGHEIKFVSNILLALLCKLRGIQVLYWGFGYHVGVGFGFTAKSKAWQSWVATRFKNGLARLADGYLAYTNRGAEQLVAIGFPRQRIFVLQNTIDMSTQCRIHDTLKDVDSHVLRRKFGMRPSSTVFVFIGRLLEIKHVDELIEAIIHINRRADPEVAVEAVIIGSGPVMDALENQAGDDPAIRFLGQIDDQTIIAQYLKVAAAVVIPGQVGLAVNHGFAQGCPIITRHHALHSPEIDYISSGYNGLIVDGDENEFVATLARFAASPEWQRQLKHGALASRESFLLENMVQRFDSAVKAILTASQASSG
jgi:glycosyltransferase involved in cell wall biosynthesis